MPERCHVWGEANDDAIGGAAVISIYIYRMLAGFEWTNVVRIHSGDEPGAHLDFASEENATTFKVATGLL